MEGAGGESVRVLIFVPELHAKQNLRRTNFVIVRKKNKKKKSDTAV